MNEEKRDITLENLFRKKLQENEVPASDELTGRFMERLWRREFFRFNPMRLNIWYLTAATAALTILSLLLLWGGSEVNESVLPGPAAGRDNIVYAFDRLPEASATLLPAPAGRDAADTGPPEQAGVADRAATALAEEERAFPTGYDREEITGERVTIAGERGSHTPGPGRVGAVTNGSQPPSLSMLNSGETMSALLPLVFIEPSVTSGCAPLPVKFVSNTPDGYELLWEFGDGGTSAMSHPDYIYDLPGRYRVTLTVTGNKGGVSVASLFIEVRERPVAAFEVRHDRQLNEGDKIRFVNMSTGAVNYLWDFGDGTFSTLSDPVYSYERMGSWDVMLTVFSADGCADSVTVKDIFTDAGMFLRFPNAFTPNQGGAVGGYYNVRTDEESKIFHPVASGVADYNLRIYSRAGLLVFESNEVEMGWDGYYKGELCTPGVYVWKVRGTWRNGQFIIMAGDITLLSR